VAVVGAAACSTRGTLVVVTDTTQGDDAVEVLASPVDPSTVLASSAVATGAGDSIARYWRLRWTADSLDRRFQRERSTLNSQAVALRDSDRRTTSYAAAYERHQRETRGAESLRVERDHARHESDQLRAGLDKAGAHLPTELSAIERASASGGRIAVTAPVVARRASLTLEAGVWWLVAVRRDSSLVLRATRYLVRAGSRDSVRLR